MREGLKDADIVMMLRLQRERMNGSFVPSMKEYFRYFGLDAEKLAYARPDALVMHPGPMNRGVEIASEVADGAQSPDPRAGGDGRGGAHGRARSAGAQPAQRVKRHGRQAAVRGRRGFHNDENIPQAMHLDVVMTGLVPVIHAAPQRELLNNCRTAAPLAFDAPNLNLLLREAPVSQEATFAGSIPHYYDQKLGPVLFDAYAEMIAMRTAVYPVSEVLETLPGPGSPRAACATRCPQARDWSRPT